MNIRKNLMTLILLIGTILSTNNTFSRGGGGWGWGVGAGIATGAIVGSSIAASNASRRDRDYDRYQADRQEREAERKERAAERRHQKEMAAMRRSGYRQPIPAANEYSDDQQ